MLTLSLCIWIHLTELPLAAACWPLDIHRTVVGWMGGSIVSDSGTPAVALRFPAILIRVAAACGLLVLLRWQWLAGILLLEGPESRRSRLITSPLLAPFGVPVLLCVGWLVAWFLLPFCGETAISDYFITASPYFMAICAATLLNGVFQQSSAGSHYG
ncbi:MAG: hypothetical protein ACK58L_10785, partial [Planctomycetota bacterium]